MNGYNQIFQDKVVDMLKRHEGLKFSLSLFSK